MPRLALTLIAAGEPRLRLERRLHCAVAGLGLALDLAVTNRAGSLGLRFEQTPAVLCAGQILFTGLPRTEDIEAMLQAAMVSFVADSDQSQQLLFANSGSVRRNDSQSDNVSQRHDHAHGNAGATLVLATLLTSGFAAVEAGMGLWAGSLALVADAGRMVNDAAALAIAAYAAWLARRPPSLHHSYGLSRAEFVAALINSLGLLALVGWLAVSAVQRLYEPEAVSGEEVSLTAAMGLAINLVVAWLLARGEKILNTREARPHVLGDLLGSVAALISGMVVTFTGWTPIDPLLALAIGALILVSSLRLLRETLHGLMEGAPFDIDPQVVGLTLAAIVRELFNYRVMAPPGVVIDGRPIHTGGLPSRRQSADWLSNG